MAPKPKGATGELALIARIRRRAEAATRTPGSELRLGIGDDCAILRPRTGEEIVVTTDFTLEGRHFRRDWHPPASAGHRTLARGLSDLAAMGARPVAAFLSVAVPRAVATEAFWLDGFFDGLFALAHQVRVPLAGGDTAEAPGEHILADIVLLGAVPAGGALRREGARPGDRLFCTGTLGGAAAELQDMMAGKKDEAAQTQPARRGSGQNVRAARRPQPNSHPQLFPEPRLRAGQALRQRQLASAAMDLSDGLSTDLRHLCEASGVAAEVFAQSLPLHPLAASLGSPEALRLALHGGEDYELLFAAPPAARVPATLAGVPLTEIGRLLSRQRGRPLVTLVGPTGQRSALVPGGWEHLR